MALSTNRKAAVKKLKQLVFLPKSDTESFRIKIEETFSNPILPNNVECMERQYGGITCDLLTPEIYSSRRIMMYIHGGSFIGGSRVSWRPFCASIANIASSRVVVPEISLAPAHPYPAAVQDIQAAFRALFTEEEVACSLDTDSGDRTDPEIIIAADGSGASQALAFVLNLKERYRKAIKHIILMSPWLNLAQDSSVIADRKSGDEVLTGECLRRCSEQYTDAANLSNPFVSPLAAAPEMLKGFPHVFIQMGAKEILLADAQTFQKKLESLGCACTLDVWPDMMYMFQLADEYLPESHLALERIGKLITVRAQEPEDRSASYKHEVEQSLNADA